MVYLGLGEEVTVAREITFRGFNSQHPMPDFYSHSEILDASSLKNYHDRDFALGDCKGPVYEIETTHVIRRIK